MALTLTLVYMAIWLWRRVVSMASTYVQQEEDDEERGIERGWH